MTKKLRKQNNRKSTEKQSHENDRKTKPLIVEEISGKGGFGGEVVESSTLPCHEFGVITTLSRGKHGSGGLVPQRLIYGERL